MKNIAIVLTVSVLNFKAGVLSWYLCEGIRENPVKVGS